MTDGDAAADRSDGDAVTDEREVRGASAQGRCGHVFHIEEELGDGRQACCWLPVYDDADRCKWHLDADKSDLLATPLRIPDGVFLREAVFRGANLAGETALAGRMLQSCDFSGADLRHADFSGADLREADLRDADLRYAKLQDADLRDTTLTGADLRDADLTDVDGRGATFEGANLENASLVRANLRAASIANAALYEVAFSDTWINDATDLGEQCVYEADVDPNNVHDDRDVDRNQAAAWTYRALEQLCRQNALPETTRYFYVREKEARRKEAWQSGNYSRALRSELSRWVMEYGSNPWRIVGASLTLIVLCAFLYPLTGGLYDTAADRAFGFVVEDPVEAPYYYFSTVFLKSLYFSAVTFATLGYGDIQPIGAFARAIATVETLLGTLLSALLVFVFSRIVTW